MDICEAHNLLSKNLRTDPGRAYCSPEGLPLGAGLILSNVRYPVFNCETRLYATLEGPVVVLTHECDIDQGNDRPLNHLALVAPLIDLRKYVAEWEGNEEKLRTFLCNLAARRVSRAVYLPCLREGFLEYGAIIYLNDLASVPVIELEQTNVVRETSLTQYGLREIDKMLESHLLRPKAIPAPIYGHLPPGAE